jgi:hypothetical protein
VVDQPPIKISQHAREQMQERGVGEDDVIGAIRHGESEPARGNRTLYRKNFQFDKLCRDCYYGIKQIAPLVVWKADRFVIVIECAFFCGGQHHLTGFKASPSAREPKMLREG